VDTTFSTPAETQPTSRYFNLVTQFPLRPLRSEEEYGRGSELMNHLLQIERSADEDDYLAVLSDLVADYEDEHHPLPTVTQGDVLRALIEERGITQAGLAAATGVAESNISAMLNNHRGISKNARTAFAKFFGVKPSRFILD